MGVEFKISIFVLGELLGFIWNVVILCDIVNCEDISAFMDKLFFNIRLMLGGYYD